MSTPDPRFPLRSLVQVDRPDGQHLGRIIAYEPAENLHRRGAPAPTGLVYHVRIEGVDGRPGEVLVLLEAALSNATKTAPDPARRPETPVDPRAG